MNANSPLPEQSQLVSRRSGMLWGSFTAEALSLGVHWIYDPEELARKHGRVSGFHAPGPDSYHPNKQAGEQGHVGDQALWLLESLRQEGSWNPQAFMQHWISQWPDYGDYKDKATRTTLSHLQQGRGLLDAGSASDELAGPGRLAPLLASLAEASEESAATAAVEQTQVTHRSPEAKETSIFLARACHRLVRGAELESTVRELAPVWALEAAAAVFSMDAVEAIGKLGRACPIRAALPSVLYLALKHGEDLELAFIENVMAGGDNCARALVLGMLLGAAHGQESIPQHWVESLAAESRIREFLEGLIVNE